MSDIKHIDQLKLERFPATKDQTLKAWNAADSYLLEWLAEGNLQKSNNLLIVNDQFGALTCCLANYHPYFWTDSFLSYTAIKNNILSHSLDSDICHVNQCDRTISEGMQFDVVILRIPKHNSLLEFQLRSLLPHIHSATKIIAAGMTKEIHKTNLRLFESIIGTTTTSLAKKKARLIFSSFEKKNIQLASQDLVNNNSVGYQIKQRDISVTGMPGVFSRDNLDIGTRVLLDFMPETNQGEKLIDLGCGTGVLGTYAAMQNPKLDITFTDESWLAVESAKRTYHENLNEEVSDKLGNVDYKVTNVLDNLPDNHYDYVLCNPPFHQQNVQTLAIANKMFKDSSSKLKASGELRVVANRHLKYRGNLLSFFKSVEVISKDSKFNIWLARGPKR